MDDQGCRAYHLNMTRDGQVAQSDGNLVARSYEVLSHVDNVFFAQVKP